jgi:serine/threonine protein kinase
MFGQLYFEIKLQSFISHPNALKMYGYFQDEKNIYLLLELASHSCMFRELKSKVKLFILFRVVSGRIKQRIICVRLSQPLKICIVTALCIETSSLRIFSTVSEC